MRWGWQEIPKVTLSIDGDVVRLEPLGHHMRHMRHMRRAGDVQRRNWDAAHDGRLPARPPRGGGPRGRQDGGHLRRGGLPVSDVVSGASAILALLRDEPGGDVGTGYVGHAAILAVNLQEVAKEMVREGAAIDAIRPVLEELGPDVRPHDADAAYAAAGLYKQIKQYGRGLGNRDLHGAGACVGRVGADDGPGVAERRGREVDAGAGAVRQGAFRWAPGPTRPRFQNAGLTLGRR